MLPLVLLPKTIRIELKSIFLFSVDRLTMLSHVCMVSLFCTVVMLYIVILLFSQKLYAKMYVSAYSKRN